MTSAKVTEEKVREYYEKTHKMYGDFYGAYTRLAIVKTLNLLGIKIEGVNECHNDVS